MPTTREEKRIYWASHIKEWKASGETQRGYCRQHHLKPYQLTYWRQVFEFKLKTAQTSVSSGFVPVQVAPSRAQGLTVRLPSGVCVEGVHAGNLAVTQALIECLA